MLWNTSFFTVIHNIIQLSLLKSVRDGDVSRAKSILKYVRDGDMNRAKSMMQTVDLEVDINCPDHVCE